MNKKTKKGIGVSVASLFVVATLAFFGISGENVSEVNYSIEEKDNIAEMAVDVPDEMSVDIVELLCNGETVTKALMPSGKLSTIPLVFSNLENLELRLYKRGEVVGIGKWNGNKLYIAAKDAEEVEDIEDNE